MKRNWKWVFAAALAVMLAVVLARVVAPARKAAADQDEDDEEQAIKTPSRVSIQNGQTMLALGANTQSQVGITVAPLKGLTSREQVTAPAIVLSTQELVSARTNYVASQANLEKARANMEVAQQEYDRLKTLYRDQQNASQKDLQAAQGTLRSDQADAQAAEQDLALQAAAVRQSWGEVVAKWVGDDSPALNGILDQHEFLVQVTLPTGVVSAAPGTIALEIAESAPIEARLVSSFPRVDPRIQGISLLYVIRDHLGLAPGLNLIARIPVGRSMRGVLIPQSAIVWWQGNAWLYQQIAPGRFVRRLVPTDTPLANGLFVSTGFSPGDQIVVRGAQVLLSEEFRSQIQPED
ncbi:MAG TPA: hypothetical protein VHX36_09495 [Candidatus Acidoferrales bacterium]|jgi:hypothetical protein|nr:hypothetical protein [Candidatus Acidoferrales bacterium]